MNSSNLTDSEKADLSAYSTDSSTAIEEADSPDSNSSGKSSPPGKVYSPGKHSPGSSPGKKVDFPTQSLRPNVVLDLDLHQRWTRRDLNVFRESKSKSLLASSSFSCE